MSAFTIAIPTLNRCELLKSCLDSALNQTTPAKILVSDNGSIDGTKIFLQSYLTERNSFRMIRRDSTMPVQQHSWDILSQIETPWVIFLSDDDFLEPDFVETISSILSDNRDVDLIYTGCDIIYDNVRVPAKVGPRFESSTNFLFEFMRGQRNICMCATAFRVDDLRRIGPQPDNILIGDMYYWARILKPGSLVGCAAGHHCNYLMYKPRHSSETNRADMAPWARESEALSHMISENIYSDKGHKYSRSDIELARTKYLSLTIANHFIFSALRNTAKDKLFVNFVELFPIMSLHTSAILRSLGAIFLPRFILNWVVLISAKLSKPAPKAWPS